MSLAPVAGMPGKTVPLGEIAEIKVGKNVEESANLPAPEIIAQEIADDLQAALEQFAAIAEDLR